MTESTKPWMEPAGAPAERARELVSRMTLEEKAFQMVHDAPPIERLGVPNYDWWSEGLHGVGFAGLATVFPQCVGLAAAFDEDLVLRVATAVSDEARAKHHEAIRRGERVRFKGLTYWSPNVNIFRDPRWGRGQETWGEDPFLTSRLGVQFVKGLQGDDPKYLKTVATPKHYAVHSGPEKLRHRFDARASEKDLRETYLPAFEACVREGRAASVMGAYNRTNGEACCASPTLLQKILRGEWAFPGFVVSDCGAIQDIHKDHKLAADPAGAAAAAVKAGCDLNCGCTYTWLPQAVRAGLLSEADLDASVRRLFEARVRLGMFDPEPAVAWSRIPFETVACEAHRALALEAARKSIVLLRNAGGLLPLPETLRTVAVIGPNAEDVVALKGNYFGTAPRVVTPLDAIQERLPHARVIHTRGCEWIWNSREGFARAVQIAARADVAILVLGLTSQIEGEEGSTRDSDYAVSGDRRKIALPEVQQALIEAVCATGTPVVLVLLNGSAVDIRWAQDRVPAIVEAWYPGQEGGTAIAEVLFGDVNPSGRTPVTWVARQEDLPPFEDYAMEGRTYRYSRARPLYPFGFGLSYTRFRYERLEFESGRRGAGDPVSFRISVRNEGERAGDEVVQVYVADEKASCRVPLRSLAAFRRVHLLPGRSETLAFSLPPSAFSLVDEAGRRRIEPGEFTVSVGGCQPGFESLTAGSTAVRSARITLEGPTAEA